MPAYREPDDALSERYPLSLVTGRVKDQWHTMTRTGNVPKLNKSESEPVVEIHPVDARPLGVRSGRPLLVSSRRGSFEARARVDRRVRPGTVWAPFHWGALRHAGGPVNAVTNEAFDRRSKQPELKFAAVRVEPL